MNGRVMPVLLISALLAHYSLSSPLMIGAPRARAEPVEYGGGGTAMSEDAVDSEQELSRLDGDAYYPNTGVYYPAEDRAERHADGIFNANYRKALGQLTARKYLHSLVTKRVGGGSPTEAEQLAKRHADGVFTDSYSRHRAQMAVRKLLSAALGSRPEDVEVLLALARLEVAALPLGDQLALQTLLQDLQSAL
ncbi:hypothetical protein ACEWY4_018418 [Coilia grayii]|uniref:Glucagon / GIP / secretin / VIP family domain-containing protein n=1 Tax=Coilia grayii TaxID=363190 RepID=A0ABD1JG88_9TELE